MRKFNTEIPLAYTISLYATRACLVAGLILVFFNWHIGVPLLVVGGIALASFKGGIRSGVSTLQGFLIIGSAVAFFYNWRVGLILLAVLIVTLELRKRLF